MGYPMAFPMPTRPAKVLFLYTFLRKDDENEKERNAEIAGIFRK